MTIERQLIDLIATDRIDIPISSMSGKLKRAKPKLAGVINLDPYKGKFEGDRVYARVVPEDKLKARSMSEAVDEFVTEHPKHGAILQQMIEDKRSVKETHLYFGMNAGCKLTAEDYMGVMSKLGFTEATARNLYPELMDISRKMTRRRDEERSILIG